MADSTTPRPATLLVLSFSLRPKVRLLNYLEAVDANGISVDFVVWDARRWMETDLTPALPASVRLHEIKDAERSLFTQRLKRLVLYRVPKKGLYTVRRVVSSNPVTRPVVPVVTATEELHRRAAGWLERHIFGTYNHVTRPYRFARVAHWVVSRSVDLDGVTRIVASEPYAVRYAWRLSKRLPSADTTVSLDRSPLPPVSV